MSNHYSKLTSQAKKKNIGVIAIKSIAKVPWLTEKKTNNTWYQPFSTQTEVLDAIRFTLSQDITTAASSSDMKIAKTQNQNPTSPYF
jgi:hypothetical protein